MRRFIAGMFASAVIAFSAVGSSEPARADGPSVAVLNFTTQGLTSDWYGNFEPGVALSDLISDALVNSGKYTVVDRKSLDSILNEHHLSSSGEVSPATAVQSGRLIGAKFLVTGNVLQLDKTGQSGAAAGSLLPGAIGVAVGGIHTSRVTLKVQVRVIDAQSGRILESFQEEKTDKATAWGAGGGAGVGGGFVAGGYGNSQFVNSSMGHLINDEAIAIAAKVDPTKLVAAPAAPALNGHVIAVEGANVIINVGSTQGVAVGQYFDVVKVEHIKDQSSGRVLTANVNTGKIQIISVSTDTAVGKTISGTPTLNNAVQNEP